MCGHGVALVVVEDTRVEVPVACVAEDRDSKSSAVCDLRDAPERVRDRGRRDAYVLEQVMRSCARQRRAERAPRFPQALDVLFVVRRLDVARFRVAERALDSL